VEEVTAATVCLPQKCNIVASFTLIIHLSDKLKALTGMTKLPFFLLEPFCGAMPAYSLLFTKFSLIQDLVIIIIHTIVK